MDFDLRAPLIAVIGCHPNCLTAVKLSVAFSLVVQVYTLGAAESISDVVAQLVPLNFFKI